MNPKLRTLIVNATPVLWAGIIGAAWHTGIGGVELFAILLPRLWWNAANRRIGAAVWFVYYCALSTDVIPNYLTIYPGESFPMPVFIWLCHAGLLAAPWFFLWSENKTVKSLVWRVAAGLLITTLPPLGIISWASPLIASGSAFPGTGFVGLVLLAAWIVISCRPRLSQWHLGVKIAMVGITLGAIAANAAYQHPQEPSSWFAATTYLGGPAAPDDKAEQIRRVQHLTDGARDMFAEKWTVAIFPELVGGDWFITSIPRWFEAMRVAEASGGTIVFGATVPLSSTRYINGIVLITPHGYGYVGARIPMPVGIWRPWAKWSAIADWFGNGQITIDGKLVATSVCFEDFMVFPFVMSMLPTDGKSPEVVVSMANNWFAKGRTSEFIQDRSVRQMAKLYGKPIVRSVAY